jgi:predicted SAM-dependent methyltransferase
MGMPQGNRIKNLSSRAVEIGANEGITNLVGRSLSFIGQQITSSPVKKKKDIIDNYSNEKRYLNVGGGNFLKKDWRVLDFYTDWYDYDPVFIDYDVDLEKKNQWPIDTKSYDLVYTSHTLEHLTNTAVEHTLAEAYRILSPGGTIRINVPDLSVACRAYEEDRRNWFEEVWLENYTDSIYYAKNKCAGYELEFYLLSFFATYLARKQYQEIDFQQVRHDWKKLERSVFFDKYSNKISDEWQAEFPGWHRNWFTAEKLERKLRNAGFVDIVETDCRQSRIPEMCTTQFDKRPHISVYVEAKKPV